MLVVIYCLLFRLNWEGGEGSEGIGRLRESGRIKGIEVLALKSRNKESEGMRLLEG